MKAKEREIHFLSENDLRTGVLSSTSFAAIWTSPRDCIKTGRAIEPYFRDFFSSMPEKIGTDRSLEETDAIVEQLMN